MNKFIIIILSFCILCACSTQKIDGVNNQDSFGWSPLHMAADNQYIKSDQESAEILDRLIDGGANIDLADKRGDTPLIIAVSSNKYKATSQLIKRGANINANALQARSPLMRATYDENLDMVSHLLTYNPNVNASTEDGWTALHIAVSKKEPEKETLPQIITTLIASGAHLEAKNSTGLTALSLATINQRHATIELLLELGANINTQDNNGWTPIMHAVMSGDTELIYQLASYNPNLQLTTHGGWQVLHFLTAPFNPLSDKDKSLVALRLLNDGANVNINNIKGRSPLHFAASNNLVDTLKVLIEAGAQINQGDKHGWSPLMRAVHVRAQKSIDALIALGAELEQTDNNGWTALHHAAAPVREKENNEAKQTRLRSSQKIIMEADDHEMLIKNVIKVDSINVIQQLLEHGANIEAKNKALRSPLYIAVSYNELLISAYFLTQGSNVNTLAYNDWTPFYRAISQGSVPMVELMLPYQPYLTHKTKEMGWSALLFTTNNTHKANDKDQAAIVHMLAAQGVNLNIRSKSGLTALMNAAINGKDLVLKALLEVGADARATNPHDNNKTVLDYAIEDKNLSMTEHIKAQLNN